MTDHPRTSRFRSLANLVTTERRVLLAVILLSATTRLDAVINELRHRENEWFEWLVRFHRRDFESFTKCGEGVGAAGVDKARMSPSGALVAEGLEAEQELAITSKVEAVPEERLELSLISPSLRSLMTVGTGDRRTRWQSVQSKPTLLLCLPHSLVGVVVKRRRRRPTCPRQE